MPADPVAATTTNNKPPVTPATDGRPPANPRAFELQHVHQVYDNIASHFSQTRYKTWPVIQAFVESLPNGAVVADIGCGNGKYMSVRSTELQWIGLDHSHGLLSECRERLRKLHAAETTAELQQQHPRQELIMSDIMRLPLRSHSVHHAICIAVLHHLSTVERRVESLKELMRIVRETTGRVLVFVWAMEQQATSKRRFDDGHQDVMVPWRSGDQVYQRYYHVFKQGELESLVEEAARQLNVDVVFGQHGYDRDNWYCEFSWCRR